MPLLRLANPSDAKAILDIYAPYIEHTSLTFETEIPSVEAFSKRIESYLQNWPWLVCEIDGIIAGYAYSSRYRERKAYQWSVECSVYIHDNFHNKRVGKALYESLFEILRTQGYNNVYAVINLPNDKSVAFHEKCGFKYFATYEKVGYKHGHWKNVGWWRLVVNEFGDEPPAPIPFAELNKDFLASLFEEKQKLIRI